MMNRALFISLITVRGYIKPIGLMQMILDTGALLRVKVFLNSSGGLFNIEIQALNDEGACETKVESLAGTAYTQAKIMLNKGATNYYRWDAAGYSAGLYLYKIVVGNRVITGKIMKL